MDFSRVFYTGYSLHCANQLAKHCGGMHLPIYSTWSWPCHDHWFFLATDPDPPHNFTAIPLSPSTVKFTWQPPQDSANEIFIITCSPQPYQFPLTTRDTVLKAGHFNPDTNYTCRMFSAHTENSTATVSFQTCELLELVQQVHQHTRPSG